MIIKGNPAGSVGFWSKHLLRDDTNERAEVKEITGLLAKDLPSALREMQAIGAQSRSHGNFMYQANINPAKGEHLTPDQWKEAVDTLEKNLGLEGHQRVVVEHVKHGRQHYHVIWNRVDIETLRVADMGGNWPIHTATARELEERFGLSPTPTPTPEQAQEKKSAPELYEIRAAERSGIEPAALKAELTELWNKADSGKAFAAAVEERGYILAKGDRRDFCIVDQAGDAHSLARRLDGADAKDVRERMADIDRDSLPSVAEARAVQQGRADEGATQQQEAAINPRQTAEALRDLRAADRADTATLREAENKMFWRDYREGKDAATAAAHEKWEKKAEAERERIDPIDMKSALMVVDGVTGMASGLADFVCGILGATSSKPPEFTNAGQMAELRAQRKALAAMENLRDSLERGERLKAEDVQNLTPTHLENIKARGDDYLRELIEDNERRRVRELDYGRARER